MEYTRERAVEESEKKWEGIVAGEDEDDLLCGFCQMLDSLTPVPLCREWCPMFKAEVCTFDGGLYKQWRRNRTKTNAKKVLAGVRKYGKLWIAEEG